MDMLRGVRLSLLVALLPSFWVGGVTAQERYDLVIHGGRVVDPETSLDAVRDVGIRAGQIVAVSESPLTGTRVIDATGLVVAPGFIDLHQHELTPAAYRLKAMDGVTTALELEIGPNDVRKFLEQRRDHSLINFGTSASHPWARNAVLGKGEAGEEEVVPHAGPATNDPATLEQITRMQQRLRDELDAGALGIGMGIQYTPGASRQEIIEMFRVAAERAVPVFVHMRGERVESVGEVIAAAAVTGLPAYRAHQQQLLGMRRSVSDGARRAGPDVTTEPTHIAGMTDQFGVV
jgi:N-acyl-D-aspartate/D-glutamate deacylase